MKKYSFFFHFNKPASKSAGKVQVSLHYRGVCHILDNVVCNVPTEGKLKNRQPRFVMVGKASELKIKDNVATLS